MTLRADALVIACSVAGLLVGILVGLLVGDARTFGGAGVLTGFAIGCLATVFPASAGKTTHKS